MQQGLLLLSLLQVHQLLPVVQRWHTMFQFELTGSNFSEAVQISTLFIMNTFLSRCRIVSCNCSCAFKASWCQHVAAVCLYRINRVNEVEYRVTIWDSINELTNEELKKLAQFLINDLPRQV